MTFSYTPIFPQVSVRLLVQLDFEITILQSGCLEIAAQRSSGCTILYRRVLAPSQSIGLLFHSRHGQHHLHRLAIELRRCIYWRQSSRTYGNLSMLLGRDIGQRISIGRSPLNLRLTFGGVLIPRTIAPPSQAGSLTTKSGDSSN